MSVVVDSVDGGGAVCLVSSCRWCAMFFLKKIEMRHAVEILDHLCGYIFSTSCAPSRSINAAVVERTQEVGF